jgi:hypothetical protein
LHFSSAADSPIISRALFGAFLYPVHLRGKSDGEGFFGKIHSNESIRVSSITITMRLQI